MNPAKRPTLKEISQQAGVSLFTASQSLSGRKGVSAQTRERVLGVAAELGYVPNVLARQLRHSRSRTVAVLTANATNEFYPLLVSAIQREVLASGYTCLVSDVVDGGRHSADREDAFIRALLEQRVAGVVLCYVPSEQNLGRLAEWGMPIVFADCLAPAGFEEVPSILSDGHEAAVNVGEHFASLGRSRWLLVAHTASWTTRGAREAGFRASARKAEASLEVVEAGNDADTAETAVFSFLRGLDASTRPDAIFATNEPLLNGTWRALAKLGIPVPEAVGVVGFDDFAWASLLTPPATVVDQSVDRLGAEAGRTLLTLMSAAGPGPAPVEAVRMISTRLVIRRSCGAN